MKKKKIVILISIIIVVLVGGLIIFQRLQPLKVDTITITESDYKEYHFEEGVVQSSDYLNIYSPVTSKVLSINVKEGDTVKKGDILLTMDNQDLNYDLNRLIAQKRSVIGQSKSEEQIVTGNDIKIQEELIAIKKRNADASKLDFDNSKLLYEKGALSLEAYTNSKDAYDSAINQLNAETYRLDAINQNRTLGSGKKEYYNSQIDMLEIQIAQLQEKINKTKIVAPIDGVISANSLKVGNMLAQNEFMFNITKGNTLEIETYVIAKYAKKMAPGDVVELEIERDYSSDAATGTITFVSNYATDVISPLGLVEKKVKVLIKPDNDAALIIGEKVAVKFITYKSENSFVLSKDYVFPWDEGEGIWIVENGQSKIYKIDKMFETASKVLIQPFNDGSIEIIIPPYPENLKNGIEVSGK